MTALVLAVLLQAAAPLQVVGLRAEAHGDQQKLIFEANGDWGPVPVAREGRELVALLPAVLIARLDPPPVAPPLEGLRLVRERNTLQVRVSVPATVPFEVQRKGRDVALVFGTAPAAEAIDPELLAMYESLRPPQGSTPDGVEGPDLPTSEAVEADALGGIGVGPLRFRPGVILGYARSDTTLDTPQPQRDTYFQVEPRLGAHLSLWEGRIRANYEPQLRMRSKFARINRASHEATGRVEIPFGSRLLLRGSHHFALSTLDTQEVDPGREYFFRLGRFRRNDSAGLLQLMIGPRLSAVLEGGRNRVDFEEETSFFEHETRRGIAGFEFLLTEATRARLNYEYDEVLPPSTRPVVERTGRAVTLSLDGEVIPLVSAALKVGYRQDEAPLAAEGGRRFAGVVFTAQVEKEFSRGTRFVVSGGRSPHLSGYEDNAFYVSTNFRGALDIQLPAGFSGRAGGGYHWNAYKTVAAGLEGPREDRLYGWTVGLSRPINRWSYLRADYGRDRRDSNVTAFNSESSTLLVQLGIGMFESATR